MAHFRNVFPGVFNEEREQSTAGAGVMATDARTIRHALGRRRTEGKVHPVRWPAGGLPDARRDLDKVQERLPVNCRVSLVVWAHRIPHAPSSEGPVRQ